MCVFVVWKGRGYVSIVTSSKVDFSKIKLVPMFIC